MKILFAAFIAIVACASSSHIPDIFYSRETTACKERQTEGPICSSCTQLSLCMKYQDTWNTIDVEKCEGTKKCSLLEEACSDNPSPCNTILVPFVCPASGIFPDPIDCQKYHVCASDLKDTPLLCPANMAFNVRDNTCDIAITVTKTCADLLVSCKNLLQRGSWPNKKNLWYVCVKRQNVIVPLINACPFNEEYDDSTHACAVPAPITTTAAVTTTTDSPTTTAAAPTTTDSPTTTAAAPTTTDSPTTTAAAPTTTDSPTTTAAVPTTTDSPTTTTELPE